jgi:hypothetical protein
LTPVIDVLVAHADAKTTNAAEYRLSVKQRPGIVFLASDFNYDSRADFVPVSSD